MLEEPPGAEVTVQTARVETVLSQRERLQVELHRSRADLAGALQDLRRATRQADPRDRIVQNPYAWVAGAFAVGFLLGATSRR